MTLRQQLIFWLATFVVFVFLLWLLSDMLMPFVAGLALAYLQAPLVDRLQHVASTARWPRCWWSASSLPASSSSCCC